MSGGLDETLCTLAFCWRIERRDGVAIGLTSHDRDLEIGGLIYRAAPGMTPAAVRSGITLEGEDSDVAGALSSDAISEADLAAGRWDGAALELRLTQWEAPGETWLLLARGEIGAVSRKGKEFSAELIGAAAAYLFRLVGRVVGTAGSRKVFRQMPLTAAFGVLVILIRNLGGYPDAVAFAVLLMNLCVPLLDIVSVPRPVGQATARPDERKSAP